MGMTFEPHVDAARCVPELIEPGIEIEVGANRDRVERRLERQHARDVEQDVGTADDAVVLLAIPGRATRR